MVKNTGLELDDEVQINPRSMFYPQHKKAKGSLITGHFTSCKKVWVETSCGCNYPTFHLVPYN